MINKKGKGKRHGLFADILLCEAFARRTATAPDTLAEALVRTLAAAILIFDAETLTGGSKLTGRQHSLGR